MSHAPDDSGGTDTPNVVADGGVDGAPLDAKGGWTTPTLVPGVNTTMGSESDPSVSPDRLTIVFQRDSNLYLGTRATVNEPFTVTPLTDLNSMAEDSSPELTSSGKAIYFSSARLGSGGDIYRSDLNNGTWQAPVLETILSDSVANENDVAISPDGLTLFLSRNSVLYKSTRANVNADWSVPATTGTSWGTSAASPSINSAGDVYLHAKSPRDLFVSRRAGNTYPTPVPVSELNTALGREAAPFVSGDDQYLWFEKDGDIYETHR